MTTIYDALSTLQEAVSAAVAGLVVNNFDVINIGGTPTPGDVLTLVLTSDQITGSPVSIAYTVKAGNTIQSIAAVIAKLLNNSSAIRLVKMTALAVAQATFIEVFSPASVTTAWSLSVSGAATETITVSDNPQTPIVGVGWPPVNALQNVARGGCLISIYDRKVGRNSTRWAPFAYNQVIVPATLTTEVSALGILLGLGSGSITLGATVSPGDAVSCVLSAPAANAPRAMGAVVAMSASGDTPASMAAKLAALINADTTLRNWVSAAAVGAAVNLTNLLAGSVVVESYAGNGGTQMRELGRRESQLQITVWTQTQQARLMVVIPITKMLAAAQAAFGLDLADGTPVQVTLSNDFPIEDDTLQDVYRHDFLVMIDYPITTKDQLFAVLAPVNAFSTPPLT